MTAFDRVMLENGPGACKELSDKLLHELGQYGCFYKSIDALRAVIFTLLQALAAAIRQLLAAAAATHLTHDLDTNALEHIALGINSEAHMKQRPSISIQPSRFF